MIVYEVANYLGIDRNNVIFTNREWKVDTLLKLKVEKHFENSDIEVKMIQDAGILVIPVEDPYWRDLVY